MEWNTVFAVVVVVLSHRKWLKNGFGLPVTSTIAHTRTLCLANLYEFQSFRKSLTRPAAVETKLTMIMTSFTAIEKAVHCSVCSYRNLSAKWIGLPLLYRFVYYRILTVGSQRKWLMMKWCRTKSKQRNNTQTRTSTIPEKSSSRGRAAVFPVCSAVQPSTLSLQCFQRHRGV